jgi:hypothetical protein
LIFFFGPLETETEMGFLKYIDFSVTFVDFFYTGSISRRPELIVCQQIILFSSRRYSPPTDATLFYQKYTLCKQMLPSSTRKYPLQTDVTLFNKKIPSANRCYPLQQENTLCKQMLPSSTRKYPLQTDVTLFYQKIPSANRCYPLLKNKPSASRCYLLLLEDTLRQQMLPSSKK